MSIWLHSVVADGLKLPDDLLPDDTKLVSWGFSECKSEFDYDDPDDELAADFKERQLCTDLALTYYNKINKTGYRVVSVSEGRLCFEKKYSQGFVIMHHGFTAAETTDQESANHTFKNFFAELKQKYNDEKVVVCSCCIADGLKTIGCKTCDGPMCKPVDPRWRDKIVVPKSNEIDSKEMILSRYAHCLAPEVNLSEKARVRIGDALLALAYFNKKKKKDYKLVDALPSCSTIDVEYVTHCNFIARQDSPASDVSKKLFFAEILKKGDKWVVTACLIIHGCKTRAGCLHCFGRKGMRVVHPTHGFCFGRYPRKDLPYRHRGRQS